MLNIHELSSTNIGLSSYEDSSRESLIDPVYKLIKNMSSINSLCKLHY